MKTASYTKRVRCAICLSLYAPTGLAAHARAAHPDEPAALIAKKRKKRKLQYPCPVCDRVFKRRNNLEWHEVVHLTTEDNTAEPDAAKVPGRFTGRPRTGSLNDDFLTATVLYAEHQEAVKRGADAGAAALERRTALEKRIRDGERLAKMLEQRITDLESRMTKQDVSCQGANRGLQVRIQQLTTELSELSTELSEQTTGGLRNAVRRALRRVLSL